ncbi:FAD-binding oxidoreductase [uncultured Sneathiella sp.]|uniref:NAD(P)/FAD-dependent oxidoreductase n=1 Tax=uncultured Sneathiella sp. TaxID=879315 RepID=UPI0030D91991
MLVFYAILKGQRRHDLAEQTEFDVAIIGAGIAGASLACELSPDVSVLLLEMEAQPGYHSTGRSAAMFVDSYGPPPIRALSRASADFLESPPKGFSESPLLSQRGVIMIARNDQLTSLENMVGDLSDSGGVRRLDAAETEAAIPILRKGYVAAGFANDRVSDIDVNALHQGYLRKFRSSGGIIKTASKVIETKHTLGRWQVTTSNGTYAAKTIVNAAGAWADSIGKMAGAEAIGLIPKRRTAMVVAAPSGVNPDSWPMVIDIDEQFYLKPDAGRLLISPADETSSLPCDVQPDELDVAICVDRIETAFDLPIRRIENKWAGLRSFVDDKCPVCGFDDTVEGFFWLAGQGGYGIQTAPALAVIAACLIMDRSVPQHLLDHGIDLADLAPGRSTLKTDRKENLKRRIS